jgi:hypothetical protein
MIMHNTFGPIVKTKNNEQAFFWYFDYFKTQYYESLNFYLRLILFKTHSFDHGFKAFS